MLPGTKKCSLMVQEPQSCCGGLKYTAIAIGYVEFTFEIILSIVAFFFNYLFVFFSFHTMLTFFGALLVHRGVQTKQYNSLMFLISLNFATISFLAGSVIYLVYVTFTSTTDPHVQHSAGLAAWIAILVIFLIFYGSFTSVLMTCFRHLATLVEVEKIENQLNKYEPQAPPPYHHGYTAFP